MLSHTPLIPRSSGLSWRGSPDLRALAYTASTDIVQVAASSTLDDLSSLSIAVLARVRTHTSARTIVGKDAAAQAGWFVRLNSTNGIDVRWVRSSNTNYSFNNTVALNVWRWYMFVGSRSGGTNAKWFMYSADWDRLVRPIPVSSVVEGSGSNNTDSGRPLAIGNTGAAAPNLALQGAIAIVALWSGQATLAQLHRFQRSLSPDAIRELSLLGYWLPGHDGQSVVQDYGPSRLHATTITGAQSTSAGLEGFWRSALAAKSPGATTYQQALSGGLTPAGGVVRHVTRRLSGGVTPAGAVVRQITRSVAGGLTPVGAVVRHPTKALAGAVTPSGAVAKTITKILAGVLTPAGTVAKTITKVLVGALTPLGALIAAIPGVVVVMRLIAGVAVRPLLATGAAVRPALAAGARFLARLRGSSNIGPDTSP